MIARNKSAYLHNSHRFTRRGGIAAVIIGLLLLFSAVGGYLIYKSVNTRIKAAKPYSKPTNDTVYVSAEKKHDRLEAYESHQKQQNVTVPRQEAAKETTKPANNNPTFSKQAAVPAKTDKAAASTPQATTPSKFVSPAREWQPINPALREATNRFKNLVYGGAPVTKHAVTILQNTPYYAAYSETRRNPLWVAYYLCAHKTQEHKHRQPHFPALRQQEQPRRSS